MAKQDKYNLIDVVQTSTIGGVASSSAVTLESLLSVRTTVSANVTASTSDDVLLCDATTSSLTVTLYAAAGNTGRVLHVKKIDSTANTVTIDGNASETIDGDATKIIASQWTSLHLVCDGSGWMVL